MNKQKIASSEQQPQYFSNISGINPSVPMPQQRLNERNNHVQYQIVPQYMTSQMTLPYLNYPIVYNPYYTNLQMNANYLYNNHLVGNYCQNQYTNYCQNPQIAPISFSYCDRQQSEQVINNRDSSYYYGDQQIQTVAQAIIQKKNDEEYEINVFQTQKQEDNNLISNNGNQCQSEDRKFQLRCNTSEKKQQVQLNEQQDIGTLHQSSTQTCTLFFQEKDEKSMVKRCKNKSNPTKSDQGQKTLQQEDEQAMVIQQKQKYCTLTKAETINQLKNYDERNEIQDSFNKLNQQDDNENELYLTRKKQKLNQSILQPEQFIEKKYDSAKQYLFISKDNCEQNSFQHSSNEISFFQNEKKTIQNSINYVFCKDGKFKQNSKSINNNPQGIQQIQSKSRVQNEANQVACQLEHKEGIFQLEKMSIKIPECLNEVQKQQLNEDTDDHQKAVIQELATSSVDYKQNSNSSDFDDISIPKVKAEFSESGSSKEETNRRNNKKRNSIAQKNENNEDQIDQDVDINEVKKNLLLTINHEELNLVKSALHINRQNANKNIIKAFQKYINETQKYCFEYKKETSKDYYYKICQNEEIVKNGNPTPKEMNQFFKKFNKFIQTKTYTNQHIKQIIQNRIYGQILFSDFLQNYSSKWLEQANAVNKDQYRIILEFYKFCCSHQQFLVFLNDNNMIQQSIGNSNKKNQAFQQFRSSYEGQDQENADQENKKEKGNC